jgi:hypothetical protein
MSRSYLACIVIFLAGCSDSCEKFEEYMLSEDVGAIAKGGFSRSCLDRVLPNGELPLEWSINRNNKIMFRILLAEGASPNTLNGLQGAPIHRAAMHNETYFLSYCLKFGGDPGLINTDSWGHGRSGPLIAAILDGSTEGVQMLVDSGADVEQLAGDGVSPLAHACATAKFDVALLLIKAGARTDDDPTDTHSFQYCIRRKRAEMYKGKRRRDFEALVQWLNLNG